MTLRELRGLVDDCPAEYDDLEVQVLLTTVESVKIDALDGFTKQGKFLFLSGEVEHEDNDENTDTEV